MNNIKKLQNYQMDKLFLLRTSICTLRRHFSAPVPGANQNPGSMTPRYRPSELQKNILVWTKKFKSKAEIPTFVSPELIDRAKSEARIKISNILIVLTILASLGAVLSGKAAAKRGESVHQMNLDWHKKYDEDYKMKEEQNKK